MMEKIIKKIEATIKTQNANNILIKRDDIEELIFVIGEFKSEVIGVALYETKLLREKLGPTKRSNIDRHFKHIIETLEQ